MGPRRSEATIEWREAWGGGEGGELVGGDGGEGRARSGAVLEAGGAETAVPLASRRYWGGTLKVLGGYPRGTEGVLRGY